MWHRMLPCFTYSRSIFFRFFLTFLFVVFPFDFLIAGILILLHILYISFVNKVVRTYRNLQEQLGRRGCKDFSQLPPRNKTVSDGGTL